METNVGTRHAIASARIATSPSSSPRSRASVSMSAISWSGLVPRDQYEWTRTLASHVRSSRFRAKATALERTRAPRSRSPWRSSALARPASRPTLSSTRSSLTAAIASSSRSTASRPAIPGRQQASS